LPHPPNGPPSNDERAGLPCEDSNLKPFDHRFAA
jgi:hypothetical protein